MTETKHYNYEALRERIAELVPDVKTWLTIPCPENRPGCLVNHGVVSYHEISLADVLMAIQEITHMKIVTGDFEGYEDEEEGYIKVREDYNILHETKKLLYIWELPKPLSQQEQPVLDFIGSLII